MSVKLPWQKTEQSTDAATTAGSTKVELPDTQHNAEVKTEAKAENKLPKGYTPPKGRPTPKRIDQEIKRGVVRDPNAATPAGQPPNIISRAQWGADEGMRGGMPARRQPRRQQAPPHEDGRQAQRFYRRTLLGAH